MHFAKLAARNLHLCVQRDNLSSYRAEPIKQYSACAWTCPSLACHTWHTGPSCKRMGDNTCPLDATRTCTARTWIHTGYIAQTSWLACWMPTICRLCRWHHSCYPPSTCLVSLAAPHQPVISQCTHSMMQDPVLWLNQTRARHAPDSRIAHA
jgi:hypothetical protein